MLSSGVRPLQATCPTANCTWPVTPSVGVCGACTESTFGPMGCNATSMYCNYSLPSGQSTQLFNFVEDSIAVGGGAGFQVVPSKMGSIFNREMGDRAYIMNLEIFGLPFGFNIPNSPYAPKPRGLNLTNTECALWMCVQAYNTTVTSNIQHDEIVDVFDSVNSTEYFLNLRQTADFQLSTVPGYLDPTNQTNFTVAFQAGRTLDNYFFNNMKGNVSIGPVVYNPSSDLIYGAWNGSTNASAWIANVATSMTNTMRSVDSVSREQYHGSQYELTVTVRWEWLVLPATLVAASLVYLSSSCSRLRPAL